MCFLKRSLKYLCTEGWIDSIHYQLYIIFFIANSAFKFGLKKSALILIKSNISVDFSELFNLREGVKKLKVADMAATISWGGGVLKG